MVTSVDADALGEADEVRRRDRGRSSSPRRARDRLDHRADRALAVGPGDVDVLERALRVPRRSQASFIALEPEAHPEGDAGVELAEDAGERRAHRGGAGACCRDRRREARGARRASRNRPPHVEAALDAVDHPVREEELAPLEPFGELLPDRALDDARPGEPDERLRLRDVHVAEEAKLAATPPVVGWRSTLMNGSPGLAEPLARGDPLGHLHQAQDPLLHPRPARGVEEHDR